MNRLLAAVAGLRGLHPARLNHSPLPVVRAGVDDAADDAPDDDRHRAGCGWFDSSHELSCGLLVTEHASPDAVAPDLPLGGWIELHLAGWRPQLQPGAA